jgi:hypothetical protein
MPSHRFEVRTTDGRSYLVDESAEWCRYIETQLYKPATVEDVWKQINDVNKTKKGLDVIDPETGRSTTAHLAPANVVGVFTPPLKDAPEDSA